MHPPPDNLEYAEGTKEGQSIPKWPGSGMEMDMSHHSLDKTLVNRHISPDIHSCHSVKNSLAIYLVIQTTALFEIPAASP